jgi:hypothetical protein
MTKIDEDSFGCTPGSSVDTLGMGLQFPHLKLEKISGENPSGSAFVIGLTSRL